MGALWCALLTPLGATASIVHGQVPNLTRSVVPFSCNGPRDLIVEKGRNTFSGTITYDHVCVIDSGILSGPGSGRLTLHAGALYVARDASIENNGIDGYLHITHDCIGNTEHFDGDAGGTLTIVARTATIDGSISANGGHGLNNSIECQGDGNTGSGGAGGKVTLTAGSLSLSGSISARGGAGGSAASQGSVEPATPNSGGNGGKGGSIDLEIVKGSPSAFSTNLDAAGGKGGAKGKGKAGSDGSAGRAQSTSSDASAVDQVVPASAVTVLSTGPAIMPTASVSSFVTLHRMACGGSRDLHLSSGTTRLDGVHSYQHVCLDGGAVLVVRKGLVLSADTILLAAGSRIVADGKTGGSRSMSRHGKYDSGGVCASHGAAHAGVPGADNEVQDMGGTTHVNAGGGGGARVALIAKAILLQGIVTSRGGDGAAETVIGLSMNDQNYAFSGGNGGSGGGVSLIAPDVQIGGAIDVAGGSGGPPTASGGDDTAGLHGSAGCVKIIAATVAGVGTPPPITGGVVLARPVPSDPVPPSRTPGVQYSVEAGHNLGGVFLRYWQAHGGLDAFGAPASEVFSDGGRQVQYTDRALLQRSRGQIAPAPLGHALAHLTPAQAIRLGAFTSTASRRYFPDTGHSLSGTFLRYWQAHQGATRLGAPLSEVFKRKNGDGSGRTYPTQWFEYGRLEYHAENKGTRYAVQEGLLGIEALRARGWL